MLESLILKGAPGQSSLVDPGILAEGLIYYTRVRLVLHPGNLRSLVDGLGREMFEEVLMHPSVALTVMRGTGATMNITSPFGSAFGYAIIQPMDMRGRNMSDAEFVEFYLHRFTQSRGWSRRIAKKIGEKASHLSLSDKYSSGVDITSAAKADIMSQPLLERLLAEILPSVAPNYRLPESWYCRAYERPTVGLMLDTNLDLSAIATEFLRAH